MELEYCVKKVTGVPGLNFGDNGCLRPVPAKICFYVNSYSIDTKQLANEEREVNLQQFKRFL